MVPRHKLVECGVAVAGGKALEGIGEPDLRVDTVEFGGLDQGGDDGPVVAAIIRTGEKGILAIEGKGSDRPLDGVGVDLDPAIAEEPAEADPAGERITDRIGKFALFAGSGEARLQERCRSAIMGALSSCRVARRSSGARPRISFSTA